MVLELWRQLAQAPVTQPETARPRTTLADWEAVRERVGLHPAVRRALEALPGVITLGCIALLFAGFLSFRTELALGLVLFSAYWLWKSWTVGFHALKGVLLIREAAKVDWRAYHAWYIAKGFDVIAWEDVRHIVIIPNHRESEAKLRGTLSAMARYQGARESLIPVLAMEAAEEGSREKGERLRCEFVGAFREIVVTVHPSGRRGEIRGKSSNEDWAARVAAHELIDKGGLDINHATITSCDADTLVPPRYWECLTAKFATDPLRYRRFWQAPCFYYNNLWQVPAPLRVPNGLNGLIHLAKLSRRQRVLFAQSTYTLSLRMARDVDFWDTDVVGEDWRMFLKCFYRFNGEVKVHPIFVPLGMDGALSRGVGSTFVNHYLMVRRWAAGAGHFAFAVEQAALHPGMPLSRRAVRAWYVLEAHASWASQWFLVSIGSLVPNLARHLGQGEIMPHWYYALNGALLTACMAPYAILMVLDTLLRPRPPAGKPWWQVVLGFGWWFATSPVSFLISTLPALDAQVRLILGKRRTHYVTEKV